MKTKYVLIDFENVQAVDLGRLKGHALKVKVFLGAHQRNVPLPLAAALQALGENGEYIPLDSVGHNALDFHVAYYLGSLSSQDPQASFYVISKDTGFDPLIKHLNDKGMLVRRLAGLGDIAPCRVSAPVLANRLDVVVSDLVRRKAYKPRTKKTLLNTIAALFKKDLSDVEVHSLLEALQKRGVVQIEGNKVSYNLPG